MAAVSAPDIEGSTAKFREAHTWVAKHAYHTPLLHSRLLNEATGVDIRLKAEMFQRGGSYTHDTIGAGRGVALERVDCVIDGLRVGETTFRVEQRYVDDIVTLPDEEIFEAVRWTTSALKVVPEGAAAAPVGALLKGLIKAKPGTKVGCVLSGGNLDLDQLRGLRWN